MWLSKLREPLRRIRQFFAFNMTDEKADKPSVSKKPQREMDFNRFAKRHVLLMVSYFGWDYYGLVIQPNHSRTIEAMLVESLIRTRLIESLDTSNFHRCGRTDSGVSAFRQVFSLDIRSVLNDGEGVFFADGRQLDETEKKHSDLEHELDYLTIINKALPKDIRALAWAPVPTKFSARYQCRQRTYKYFFPKGNLDIEAMRAACPLLIGAHDFRNFCKIDLLSNAVKTTVRSISAATIEQADPSRCINDPCDMYVLTISSQAFLWHQIRAIVSVLVLIGRGDEQPDVITKLFDVEAYPRRPQYTFALETPLVLYDCKFDDIKWQWHEENRRLVLSQMQYEWANLAIKAQLVKSVCDDLQSESISQRPDFETVTQHADLLTPGGKMRKYVSLLKRACFSDSLDEKRQKSEAKKARRLERKLEEARASGGSLSDME